MEFTKTKRNKIRKLYWKSPVDKTVQNYYEYFFTKVISSKSEIDNEKTMEQGCNFVEYATKKLVNFDRSIIVYSDQSGFNYELHSTRHYRKKRHCM